VNVLDIKGFCKVYTSRRKKNVNAVTNLDLAVESGEIFGFLGPNGAGKSTTIKAVMGLLKPTSGSLSICGISVTEAHSRKNVGYLPENPSFYDFLTSREYLTFVGTSHRMAPDRIVSESERVLTLLELKEAADRPIRGYSKGMVQRLGIAQALLHDPDLYILDEPMSGLDPLGRALVKDIIADLKKQGKTVFFSTHITSDVEVICDRVGVIVEGTLRVVDTVENILERSKEGYRVQVKIPPGHDPSLSYELVASSKEVKEFFVPCEQIKVFMKQVVDADGDIARIEPVRKNVESFFLETVAKGK
jgi:ABC-2 type transport system ATP-binding protein